MGTVSRVRSKNTAATALGNGAESISAVLPMDLQSKCNSS